MRDRACQITLLVARHKCLLLTNKAAITVHVVGCCEICCLFAKQRGVGLRRRESFAT